MFIVLYNVLGAVFRGMGDPKTPLLTVVIACAVNVTGDLLLVAMLHMGAAGAALATVAAQNMGAGYPARAKKALRFSIGTALAAGGAMLCLPMFRGGCAGIRVLRGRCSGCCGAQLFESLRHRLHAVADPVLFYRILQRQGKTVFVMLQGFVGAFLVRIPLVVLLVVCRM